MSVAGAEDAQGAEAVKTGRQAGGALHRSAVGDRHSQPDQGDRRQGRDHRARRAAHRVRDRKGRAGTKGFSAALIMPAALRLAARHRADRGGLLRPWSTSTNVSRRWGWGPPITAARLMTPARRFASAGARLYSSTGSTGP